LVQDWTLDVENASVAGWLRPHYVVNGEIRPKHFMLESDSAMNYTRD
jgi:hypothetical protein